MAASARTTSRRPPDAVVRRTPFSSTRIAARGLRTQQRIVDAALRVFAEEGYHRGSIDRIAKPGGCSRVAFYQYFASKQDVFRHLAAQVTRQLAAATDTLDPITPDRAGRAALRAWVARHAQVYARYQPVFNAYQAAVEDDRAPGTDAGLTTADNIAKIRSRLDATTLPARQVEPVVGLLLETVTHTFDVAGILEPAAPRAYPRERIEELVTDVMHRALFGRIEDANVRPPNRPRPPALRFSAPARALLRGGTDPTAAATANGALAALLAAAPEVFVDRGYHNTRVDDLAAAAGVSHGAFYRYFCDKAQLARVLNARALRDLGATVAELPDVFALETATGRRALRRWLRHYNAVHVDEAAMLRVWVDGALQDAQLRAESAAPLDWGRRRLATYLRPRAFGDADLDAVVFVALLGVFGARRRPAPEIEAASHVVERGLLGR
jgi:AcrR family transcriptional regulator